MGVLASHRLRSVLVVVALLVAGTAGTLPSRAAASTGQAVDDSAIARDETGWNPEATQIGTWSVMANDARGDHIALLPHQDSGWGTDGHTITLYSGAAGAHSVGYTLYDAADDPVGTATLTVVVLEGQVVHTLNGDGQATIAWQDLPSEVTGLRLGYTVDGTPTTTDNPGTGPVTLNLPYGTYDVTVAPYFHDAVYDPAPTTTVESRGSDLPPTAVDDAATVVVGGWPTGLSTSLHLTGNDTDPDGDDVRLLSVSQPSHGTRICSLYDGWCAYRATRPAHDEVLTYTAQDSFGRASTNTARVRIHVRDVVTGPDSAGTYVGESTVVPVLANDTGLEPGDHLRVTSQPWCASASVVPGAPPGAADLRVAGLEVGSCSFRYHVISADGLDLKAGLVAVTVGAKRAMTTGTLTRPGPLRRSVKTRFVVTGVMTPARDGAPVILQRRTAGGWAEVATAAEGPKGGYRFSVLQPTGSRLYRAYQPGTATTRPAATNGRRGVFYEASLPSSRTRGDEFVTVLNTGASYLDLDRWTLGVASGHLFRLPARLLAPGSLVRVHPGFGTSAGADLYLNRAAHAFGEHDTLRLRDQPFRVLVATRSF